MIRVLLLAAGDGRRMGGQKLLARVGGVSLLRRAARTAVEAGLGPLTVVLGPEAGPLRAELAGVACLPVVNPDPGRGLNGSLAVGIASLPAGAEALLVMLADMPLVTPAVLRALAARFAGGGAILVASRCGDQVAPPVLYAGELLAELSAGPPGDGQGRAVVRRHAAAAAFLDLPADALLDVDDPASLREARLCLGEPAPAEGDREGVSDRDGSGDGAQGGSHDRG